MPTPPAETGNQGSDQTNSGPQAGQTLSLTHIRAKRPGILTDTRDICLILLMFTGLLRQSEAVALDLWLDLLDDGSYALCIFAEKSKTE